MRSPKCRAGLDRGKGKYLEAISIKRISDYFEKQSGIKLESKFGFTMALNCLELIGTRWQVKYKLINVEKCI
jgi:hypothetical protein